MILTLTLNPAVDKSTSVDRLIPEKKLRCETPVVEAGGGGINVSKALHELGAQSCALFPSGGNNGKLLERLLHDAGIACQPFAVDGETRESFTVSETGTNAQYRFVLPGAPLNDTDTQSLLNALGSFSPRPSLVVASGSLPPGAPDDYFGKVAARCRQMGARFIADTSGAPLQRAVEEGVYLIKPNLSELCSLVGRDYLELHEVDDAAQALLGRGGVEHIVVSMGPSGALAISKEDCRRIPAPVVRKRSTVGAGDSMIAGISWKLQEGASFLDAVRFGVACGTAATMNAGSQLFRKEDAFRLYEWICRNS